MKRFLLVAVAACLVFANPARSEEISCKISEAVYKPQQEEWRYKSDLSYTMTIENLEPDSIMNFNNRISLNTFRGEKLLSTFYIRHGCSGSGAITCHASYKTGKNKDGKDNYNQIPVTGIDKDFHEMNIDPNAPAPYALVLTNFVQTLYYTMWQENKIESINYFTEERVHPSISANIWLLSECRK